MFSDGLEDLRKRGLRRETMTTASVPSLILKLAVATIISMTVTGLYNMADAYFVGHISTGATAAVGISFAYQTLVQALGFFFGAGSGNFISTSLGAGNDARAERMAATGFFSAIMVGAVLMVCGLVYLTPLSRLLGAIPAVVPLSNEYLRFQLLATPILMSQMVMNNQLRLQGHAHRAMWGLLAGAVLNIILDPLFIFKFGMGVGGASAATLVSQSVSWLLLYHATRRDGSVHITLRNFTPKCFFYKEIFKGGLPSLSRQALGCVSTIMLNLAAVKYALPGDEDSTVAAFAVVSRAMLFAMSIILGFGQGFQPVCGFNWGAGKYGRVKSAYIFTIKTTAVMLVVFSTAGFVFSSEIVAFFRSEDPVLIEIGSRVLRWQCAAFPLVALTTPTNMLLQNVRRTFTATLLAMSRQGLFFIPALLVLPRLWGLEGLEATLAVSDSLTFLLALPISLSFMRELNMRIKAQAAV